VIELLAEEAPMTAESFVALARRGFFDGTTIHRVVPDFVVQAGDPRGDGTGGPGYALRDELNPLPYVRGRVGMALAGPDTGGSQWFVALSRQPHLDGAYTVFGEVTAGLEVLDRIEQNDRLLSVKVREESRPAPPGLSSGGR
jgi:cyclophilin family peptidyl-prolyl cis-trans isomerase